ncbi:hypothetical protein AB0C81_09395 [Streptomyces roseoverticillatus]|uniref:hypothetical protein n=1 Tax=Streptomyces roseoverticillatus TaxID=66429 RepID=UPI0033EC5785
MATGSAPAGSEPVRSAGPPGQAAALSAALAATTTNTVDMPKGTHLTAYKGGVRAIDDTDGSTIAR